MIANTSAPWPRGAAHAASSERLLQALAPRQRTVTVQHAFDGEPFLTGYGLYPNIERECDRLPWDYLMGFADGEHSLVEIADRAGVPVTDFDEPVRLMVAHGLLKELVLSQRVGVPSEELR